MKKFGKKMALTLALAVSLTAGAGTTTDAATKYVKKVKAVDKLSGKTTITLTTGKKATLKTTVTPTKSKYNKSKYKKVTFKTSNKAIATVSSKGVVTAEKKAGTAKITVKTKYNNKTAKVTVKVVKGKVTKVTLDQTSGSLEVGKSVQLKAAVKTSGKKPNKKLAWSTSDKKVATVSSSGLVKAVAKGSATITVKSTDGTNKKATYKVTVTEPAPAPAQTVDVTGITLSNSTLSMEEGATTTVTATVAPENATNKTLTVKSSDDAVAKATINGSVITVEAVKKGDATVTVTSNNGKTATITVSVTEKKGEEPENPSTSTYVTVITPTKDKVVDVNVAFDGTNGEAAANDAEKLLLKATTNGEEKAVKVNGADYTVKNENGKMYVVKADGSAKKELKDIIGKDAKVVFTYSTNLANAVAGLEAKDFEGQYSYAISVDSNTISNMKIGADGKVTATIGSKTYTATVSNGVITVDEDVSKTLEAKYLKDSGYATVEAKTVE